MLLRLLEKIEKNYAAPPKQVNDIIEDSLDEDQDYQKWSIKNKRAVYDPRNQYYKDIVQNMLNKRYQQSFASGLQGVWGVPGRK